MRILVTGAAGFIGFHVVQSLLTHTNFEVIGLDNINSYYDVRLKYHRLEQCGISCEKILENQACQSTTNACYTFYYSDISDADALHHIFKSEGIEMVIHLAAQAGVRYSLENPQAYIQSNLVGFANMLECGRHYHIKHLIYASSSSVYGANNKVPFSEEDKVDHPVSLYAATKKSNELMAHSYSHLYHLPTTGLRFFTVYGPWGRPDMSPMLFADAIQNGRPISLFNHGDMSRDFTYIDDVVQGIMLLIDHAPDEHASRPFYEVYNIGHSSPVQLLDFVQAIERAMGEKAILQMADMQPGDVKTTYADTSKLTHATGYHPTTSLDDGIREFTKWLIKLKVES